MLIFLLLASPALGIRLDGSVGAVEVPKKGETRKTDVLYVSKFVPKFFNFVWGSRLPSPRILNEAGVWVEGFGYFFDQSWISKGQMWMPWKELLWDDSLVCDVKTRTCKPSLGSVCSTSYFFTECASKDTYNVSTECALSAGGYHRCCIKSGQPLALTTYTDECCWAKREMFVNEILMASLATIQCLPPELARAEKRWLGSDSRETHQGFTDLNLVTHSTLSVSFFDPLRFSKVLVIHSTFFALFKNVVLICFVRALDFSQHEK